MHLEDAAEDGGEVTEELLLHLLPPHEHGHLFLEIPDEAGMDSQETRPLHQLIDLAEGRVAGQVTEVVHQVFFFHLEELTVVLEHEGLIPEATDIDTQHLRGLEHLINRWWYKNQRQGR